MFLMAMAFVLVAFVFVCGFGRLGRGVVSRVSVLELNVLPSRLAAASQTICELGDTLPDCVLGETTPFGRGDTSSHGKRVYRQGQTGQGPVCTGGTRKGTVTAGWRIIIRQTFFERRVDCSTRSCRQRATQSSPAVRKSMPESVEAAASQNPIQTQPHVQQQLAAAMAGHGLRPSAARLFLAVLLPLLLPPPVLRAASAQSASFTQSAQSVAVFDFVEITARLSAPAAFNPFTEASITGDFQLSGSADPTQIAGFADSADGSLYRIRFMPSTPAPTPSTSPSKPPPAPCPSPAPSPPPTSTSAAPYGLIPPIPGTSSIRAPASTTSSTAPPPTGSSAGATTTPSTTPSTASPPSRSTACASPSPDAPAPSMASPS